MRHFAAILALSWISIASWPAMAATRDGQKAPAFTLTDLNGSPMSLADLRGNIVVMHFAASW